MPEVTRYEHGVPSWVDIGTHDLTASVRFYAADVDADAATAAGLGASVIAGPTDIPGTGRFAVLTDPDGAAFALFQG